MSVFLPCHDVALDLELLFKMTTIEAKDLPKIRLHGCGSIVEFTGETNGQAGGVFVCFVFFDNFGSNLPTASGFLPSTGLAS